MCDPKREMFQCQLGLILCTLGIIFFCLKTFKPVQHPIEVTRFHVKKNRLGFFKGKGITDFQGNDAGRGSLRVDEREY